MAEKAKKETAVEASTDAPKKKAPAKKAAVAEAPKAEAQQTVGVGGTLKVHHLRPAPGAIRNQ